MLPDCSAFVFEVCLRGGRGGDGGDGSERKQDSWRFSEDCSYGILLSLHWGPIHPSGHRHWPSLGRHVPLCWHVHCCEQEIPHVLTGHGTEQSSPFHPGRHRHWPDGNNINFTAVVIRENVNQISVLGMGGGAVFTSDVMTFSAVFAAIAFIAAGEPVGSFRARLLTTDTLVAWSARALTIFRIAQAVTYSNHIVIHFVGQFDECLCWSLLCSSFCGCRHC